MISMRARWLDKIEGQYHFGKWYIIFNFSVSCIFELERDIPIQVIDTQPEGIQNIHTEYFIVDQSMIDEVRRTFLETTVLFLNF